MWNKQALEQANICAARYADKWYSKILSNYGVTMVQSFVIEQTDQTPRLVLDAEAGTMELVGICYVEDPMDFFAVAFEWMDEYFASGKTELHCVINITYLNTAASKAFRSLMRHMDQHCTSGRNITITWYYEDGDDDALDMGNFYSTNLRVPITIECV